MVIGQNVHRSNSGDAEWEDIQLTTRFLVHPGVDAKVTCTAQVRARSLGNDDRYLTLVDSSFRFADTSVDNATSGQPIQASVDRTTYFALPDDTDLHLPSTGMFDLAPGFTGLSVFGDTNYEVKPPSCPESGPNGTSTAVFTLYVNQWKADGQLCHTQPTEPLTKTMCHHIYVPLHMLFEIKTHPGCIPRFNTYVTLTYLDGWNGGTHGIARDLRTRVARPRSTIPT